MQPNGLCHMGDSLNEKVNRGVQDKLTEQAVINRIMMSSEEISVEEMCKIISGWKKQLCLVVEENGDHIEHRLEINEFYFDIACLRRCLNLTMLTQFSTDLLDIL